jgi:type II secretory pathway predicted ATPase ExeA
MYHAFYGFEQRPFSLLPDPACLFLSLQHQRALGVLEYALRSQAGFSVLTGDIGTGKTTLVRALLNQSDQDLTVGLVNHTGRGLGRLSSWVLLAFGLEGLNDDPVRQHERFIDFAIEQYAKGRRTVLVVDEAQNLGLERLEELRMLSNVNADRHQVLQTILVGQPGLRDTLRLPALTQLAQRVLVDFHLGPLTETDTAAYIAHRLRHAGGDPSLFTTGACVAVHRYSGGIPRLTNLICDLALVYGFAESRSAITEDVVHTAARDREATGVAPALRLLSPAPSAFPGATQGQQISVRAAESSHGPEAVGPSPRRPSSAKPAPGKAVVPSPAADTTERKHDGVKEPVRVTATPRKTEGPPPTGAGSSPVGAPPASASLQSMAGPRDGASSGPRDSRPTGRRDWAVAASLVLTVGLGVAAGYWYEQQTHQGLAQVGSGESQPAERPRLGPERAGVTGPGPGSGPRSAHEPDRVEESPAGVPFVVIAAPVLADEPAPPASVTLPAVPTPEPPRPEGPTKKADLQAVVQQTAPAQASPVARAIDAERRSSSSDKADRGDATKASAARPAGRVRTPAPKASAHAGSNNPGDPEERLATARSAAPPAKPQKPSAGVPPRPSPRSLTTVVSPTGKGEEGAEISVAAQPPASTPVRFEPGSYKPAAGATRAPTLRSAGKEDARFHADPCKGPASRYLSTCR